MLHVFITRWQKQKSNKTERFHSNTNFSVLLLLWLSPAGLASELDTIMACSESFVFLSALWVTGCPVCSCVLVRGKEQTFKLFLKRKQCQVLLMTNIDQKKWETMPYWFEIAVFWEDLNNKMYTSHVFAESKFFKSQDFLKCARLGPNLKTWKGLCSQELLGSTLGEKEIFYPLEPKQSQGQSVFL